MLPYYFLEDTIKQRKTVTVNGCLEETVEDVYGNVALIGFWKTVRLLGLVRTLFVLNKLYSDYKDYKKGKQNYFGSVSFVVSDTDELRRKVRICLLEPETFSCCSDSAVTSCKHYSAIKKEK